MALSNECAVYVNDDMASRAAFIEFFSDLLPLIEATYCYNVSSLYYMKNHSSPDYKQLVDSIQDEEGQDYSFIYLTKKEMLDPRPVMTAFCIKYPIVYARRELWDFFQAAESYSGPFRAHVSKYMFSEYYLKLLTLVEAAYAITRQVPDKD